MNDKKNRGMAVVAIGTVPLILVLGNSMLIPVLPGIKRELDISQFQVSLIVTVFSVAAAVSIPFLGYVSDRFSRKAVMLPALFLYGAGGLLAGFSGLWFDSPYKWIISGRILQGIGAAGTAPIAMALTGDLFKGKKQSKVLGLVEASNGIGKVVSPMIGSLLAILSWYYAFFVYPVFCFLSILLLILFVREKKRKTESLSAGKYMLGLLSVFKTEGRWLFVAYLTGAVCLFTLFGILFYISDILETKHQMEGFLKGLILAVPLLFMTATSYITGSRIGKEKLLMKKLIVTGLLLMTVSFFSLAFVEKPVPFFLTFAVGSVGTGLVLPCNNSFITGSVSTSKRGFVTSLYGSVRFLGAALGPPVYSALMDWSVKGMFMATAGLSLLIAVICLALIRVRKKSPREKRETLFERLRFT